MPTAKLAAIAAALVTIWSTGPVMGQPADMAGPGGASGRPAASAVEANARPGERAAAVIRAIEDGPAAPRGVAVDATELARARAAGEMQVAERGAAIQVERIQIDEPVRTRPGASAPAGARGAEKRASARNATRPQIARVEGRSAGRSKTAAIVPSDEQGKAEIAWSAPASDDRRTTQESDKPTLY